MLRRHEDALFAECPYVEGVVLFRGPGVDVQAVHRFGLAQLGVLPAADVEEPVGLERQFDTAFMLDAFAHLLLGQPVGQTGQPRPVPDFIDVVIGVVAVGIRGRRTGVFVERLGAVEVNLSQAEVDPESLFGLQRIGGDVYVVDLAHQVPRLAVVRSGVFLAVHPFVPEGQFVIVLPDLTGEIDTGVEPRFAVCVHVAHAGGPAAGLGLGRISGLRVAGFRIDDGVQPVVGVSGDGSRAVLHLIGVHHLLCRVEDRRRAVADRVAAPHVMPVIAQVLSEEYFAVPVFGENLLVVLHGVVVFAVIKSESGRFGLPDTAGGRFGGILPLFGILGLGNQLFACGGILHHGQIGIAVVERGGEVEQHAGAQCQRGGLCGASQVGGVLHGGQQFVGVHAVLGDECGRALDRNPPEPVGRHPGIGHEVHRDDRSVGPHHLEMEEGPQKERLAFPVADLFGRGIGPVDVRKEDVDTADSGVTLLPDRNAVDIVGIPRSGVDHVRIGSAVGDLHFVATACERAAESSVVGEIRFVGKPTVNVRQKSPRPVGIREYVGNGHILVGRLVEIIARCEQTGASEREKQFFQFHIAMVLEIYLHAAVDRALLGIVARSRIGLRIDDLQAVEAEEVRSVHEDADFFDAQLPAPPFGQRVAYLGALQAEVARIAQIERAFLVVIGVVAVDDGRIFGFRVVGRARDPAVVVILARDVVAGVFQRIGEHVLRHEECRNAGRPGEAEGEIHSLVGHRTSESEHDLRGPGESDGRPVVGRDLAVAVQVEVFDVARPHLGHEGLRGAVGDLLFAGEEAERDVAEWLGGRGFRASRNADAAYRPRRCGCAHR